MSGGRDVVLLEVEGDAWGGGGGVGGVEGADYGAHLEGHRLVL